jgi:hypothetical protein
MTKRGPVFLAVLAFLSVSFLLSAAASRVFSYPYPQAKISPVKKFAVIDMSGALFGARRLASDIAWIELLQYYGSPEKPLDKETEYRLSWDMTKFLLGIPLEKEGCHKPGCTEKEHEHYDTDYSGGVYSELYSYCLRIAELDPFFSYVYLYGAGALAWNLNRPDEAITLLNAGISSIEKFSPEITKDVHQPFWQYHLYLSAIIYSKSGKYNEMTALLETAVKQPKCPNMVKAILANIFQKNGKSRRALELWIEIYDSKDPTYANKALSKISELRAVSGI